MIAVSIILGILFIVAGIVCMCSPVATFFSLVYLLAIGLFVYGIWGIIRFFRKRAGGFGLVISILAVIIGFIYLFRPGNTPAPGDLTGLDRVVLYIIAIWFVIKGIIGIKVSVSSRLVNRTWVLGLIVGVLSIILGIYSLVYPVVGAVTVGTLTGFYLVQCGLDLFAFGTKASVVKGAVKAAEDAIRETVEDARETVSKLADEVREDAEAAEEAAEEAVEEVKADAEAAAEAAGTDFSAEEAEDQSE